MPVTYDHPSTKKLRGWKVPYVGNVYAVIWLFEGRIHCKFSRSVVQGKLQCTRMELWEYEYTAGIGYIIDIYERKKQLK